MTGTAQIRILRFFLLSKVSLLYNRTLINLSCLSVGRELSRFIKSFMRVSAVSLKNWHRRKKCNIVSTWIMQDHTRLKASTTLCRNLHSRKWLGLNLSNFVPTWTWMLKTLFSVGLIKFSRALWKLS